jgi:hypothetical protein
MRARPISPLLALVVLATTTVVWVGRSEPATASSVLGFEFRREVVALTPFEDLPAEVVELEAAHEHPEPGPDAGEEAPATPEASDVDEQAEPPAEQAGDQELDEVETHAHHGHTDDEGALAVAPAGVPVPPWKGWGEQVAHPSLESLAHAVGHELDGDRTLGAEIALDASPEMVVIELDQPDAELAVRSRVAGEWNDWQLVHPDIEEAPDGVPGGEGADSRPAIPMWLGDDAEALEVVVLHGDVDAVEIVQMVSTVPAEADRLASLESAVVRADAGVPPIRPRSTWDLGNGWATQNSGCGSSPRVASNVRGAVVHHTAGENPSPARVATAIRGVYAYHVNSRGWCDIAYNFVVDPYGQIWEGRSGGIDRAVIGGHTTGFNTGTVGVVALGQFHSGAPNAATAGSAMVEGIARVVAWKFALHGVPASGPVQLTSASDGPRYKTGEIATVPTVSGHGDLGQTSCPGSSLWAQMPTIRTRVAALAYADGLFQTFVGRSPSDGEKVALAADVARTGRYNAALRLAGSETWAGVMIDDLYAKVLNRAPDADGRRYWLGVMSRGTRFETVAINFYGSAEYYAASGSPEGFVTRLYQALLHRAPDRAGLAYWSGQLQQGRMTSAGVVAGFYASLESRLDRVDSLYRSILGRSPDVDGHRYWADQLRTNDDIRLAAFLASSEEFHLRQVR